MFKEITTSSQRPEAPSPPETTARPDNRIKVFFVDDDDLYREAVKLELIRKGFLVEAFTDGKSLLAKLGTGGEADLLVLEWELSKTAGLGLLPQLRQRGVALPVVILTGQNSPTHERIAFERGAIEFIDKARGTAILVTRLRLAAGRVQDHRQRTGSTFELGRLALMPSVKRACWNGHDVGLTTREYEIVHLLATSSATFVSYRRIYDEIHSVAFIGGNGADSNRAWVRTSIKRIRSKFKLCGAEFSEIMNYSGFGYRWRNAGDCALAADLSSARLDADRGEGEVGPRRTGRSHD